jgi:osmotically-inducible protein OsmY
MSFMATAVAVTAATGIYSSYTGYQAGKAQADNIKAQAKQDRLDTMAQMDADSAEESRVASAQRKENRRLRSIQEAAYAKSGVLMEGSAADVLTKQRATDEANVQNIHIGRGNQRAQDIHKMDRDYQSSLYLAKTTKSAATTKAITSLLGTAGSVAGGLSKIPSKTPTTPVTPAAGQSPWKLAPATRKSTSSFTLNGKTPLKRWI